MPATFSVPAPLAPFLVAADEIGLEFEAAPDEKQANALGGVEFVRRKGKEVHPQRVGVYFQFARRLGGVGVKKHALAAANGGDFLDGKNNARFIIGRHDRDQGGVGPDGLIEQMQVQQAVGINGQEGDLAALLAQELGVFNDGGMFDRRGQQVAFARLGQQRALQRRVVAFGPATGEDDFFRLGPEQGGHLLARRLEVFGDLAAEAVGAGGIAQKSRKNGSIASTTSGATRVVALLSK